MPKTKTPRESLVNLISFLNRKLLTIKWWNRKIYCKTNGLVRLGIDWTINVNSEGNLLLLLVLSFRNLLTSFFITVIGVDVIHWRFSVVPWRERLPLKRPVSFIDFDGKIRMPVWRGLHRWRLPMHWGIFFSNYDSSFIHDINTAGPVIFVFQTSVSPLRF